MNTDTKLTQPEHGIHPAAPFKLMVVHIGAE
jgi:hypothetical protein